MTGTELLAEIQTRLAKAVAAARCETLEDIALLIGTD
jgi:hypothetical protein